MQLDPEIKKEFKKLRKEGERWHLLIGVLLLMIVIILLVPGVHAQTITMSNPGAMNQRDIIAYFPNGTMAGFYNDTSVITTDPNESYIFVLKPLGSNPMTDPADWMTNHAFPWVQTYIIPIVLFVFVIYIATRRG